MARTIESMSLLVSVAPYDHDATHFDSLLILAGYRQGRGFYVSWTPVLVTGYGYQTGGLPSQDPLVGGGMTVVRESTRNSAKEIHAMYDNLDAGTARKVIAFLFDQRLFDMLNACLRSIALDASWATEQRLQEIISQAGMATKEGDRAALSAYLGELKAKHRDALLINRRGDFYETYGVDARTCASVLSIECSHRDDDAAAVCGFPSSALDGYLPKLIRAGYRVAIVEIPESIFINNNQDNTTMRLSISKNNETRNVQPAAQVMNPSIEAPAAPAVEDADAVEIPADAVVPEAVGEIVPAPEEKPKVTLRKKTPEVKGAYSVVLLPCKDGGQWPKLYGFKGEDDAKAMADRLPKSVSASWDYGQNGEGRETKTRHWYLKMGRRYCDVAKSLCAALNSGDKTSVDKAIADGMGVYETAKAEGKAARAEKSKDEPKDEKPKAETKGYTDMQVAQMMSDMLSGKPIPEDVRKHLQGLIKKAA